MVEMEGECGMSEIRASDLSARYGFTGRYWIKLAAAGRIPGAWQPSGPRGQWVFDRAKFTIWARANGYTRKDVVSVGAPSDLPVSPPRAARDTDVVYVIYSAGHIKFGVSSNVTRRRYGFTTASPCPVHLVATIEGSTELERNIHRRFASAWQGAGEWFRLTAEVRAFVLQCESDGASGKATLERAEADFKRWLAELAL